MVLKGVIVEKAYDKAKYDDETLTETTNVPQPVEEGVGVSVDHKHVHIKLKRNDCVNIICELIGPVLVVINPKNRAFFFC